MSVTHAAPTARPELTRTGLRILIALAAVAAVAGGLALLAWLTGFGAAPVSTPKSPFGTGIREAAPAATGFGGAILALQTQFNQAMTAALEAFKKDTAALWSLVALGFLYGVFHAAGPGHGKGVIAAYILASRRTLLKGLGLSVAAALLQALVAIVLIAVLAGALRATAASVDATARFIEVASFAAIALFGAVLLWRKTASLTAAAGSGGHGHDHHHHHGHVHGHHDRHAHHHDHGHGDGHEAHGHHAHDHVCDEHCGHVHIPPPAALEKMSDWRETLGVVVAAGARPCSGAILLLVFALSQGLFAAGILATLAMAFGTAITTGALAALAVFAKGLAVRLAGGESGTGPRVVAGLEVLAAAFVLVLGASLLLGLLWSKGAGA